MTNPEIAREVINDCAEMNISLVWLYKSIGKGSVSPEAMEFCRQKNIRVIPGYCPYMFLPDSGMIHKIHKFFMKLAGNYPK